MDTTTPDFSEGVESYVSFDNVSLPGKYRSAELDLTAFLWDSLTPEGLEVKGIIPYTAKDGKIIVPILLSTSHELGIYDPTIKRLTTLLYSCDAKKTGVRAIDERIKYLKTKPTFRSESAVIVDKDVAKQKNKAIYASVEEALEDVKLTQHKQHYVTAVFFDVPNKRIDEDKLESIFTECLQPDERKPTTELVHRFPDEGYTYIHQSKSIFGGGHSFTKKNSLANSLCGKGSDVAQVLKSFERELKSKQLMLEKRF